MNQHENIMAVDQVITPDYAIYQGDACELIRAVPGDSVHFGIHLRHSEGLYRFSNHDRDISNNDGDGFGSTTLPDPGTSSASPCRGASTPFVMQLPTSKIRHGHIGCGISVVRLSVPAEDAGWIFHLRSHLKDPVVAQQRTKSIRSRTQIEKDSTSVGKIRRLHADVPQARRQSRRLQVGLIDMSVSEMRQCPQSRAPTRDAEDAKRWYSIEVWQRYASPVWMDDQTVTRTCNIAGRDEHDDSTYSAATRRSSGIELWSNPGTLF